MRCQSLHDSKVAANLYDIADNFEGKNHTFRHFKERIKLYNEEGFDYKLHRVQI